MSALERGLALVAANQRPSGLFASLVGPDLDAPDAELVEDNFGTAVIAHAIAGIDSPVARAVVERAADALESAMEPPGVWRFWTRDFPGFDRIPPDVDDTASISLLLARLGRPVPDNRSLLLAARARDGLFHTWLLPRWPPPVHLGYWRVATRRARHPVAARRFWREGGAAPGNVDGVVNANVLAYLGAGPWAAPVVAHLVSAVAEGREADVDGWYRGVPIFAYALCGCLRAGVRGLDQAAEIVARRLVAGAGDDGSLAPTALDSALATCALAQLGFDVARARAALLAAQADDGGWPASPIYQGAREDSWRWGSREITTAICLQALAP